MGNTAVRTLVLVLAVAGFGASSMYSAATARTTNEAKTLVAQPNMTTPSPVCSPKGTCGMD